MANLNTLENFKQDDGNFQNSDPNSSPYDSENLDNESDSESKDITEKDIEKDLIENDPSEGFETDMDRPGNNKDQSGPSDIIETDQDNPLSKEFEIGKLSNEDLKEDERAKDETSNSAVHFNRPSERKF
jgi:hypothetical protein